ncbi:MAG: enoyl-CoA hydratase/isomerase family protein, partial [Verrucomicrobia bacterium]|nr:enoyl-CoA hydratase/isomerase family protein [Verrucomicrobiota bacterium]
MTNQKTSHESDPAEMVRLERRADGVAILTLNRPPLNLFTLEMTRVFDRRLREIGGDSSIRSVVLTGSGDRAFGAGSDIKEFPEYFRTGTVIETKLRYENEVFNRLEELPQPTVAAMKGVALGGGLELALCCDFRVGASDLRLALPEIKLGVYPGSGGLVRLPRLIGAARAKEILFLGDFIPADTALHWGLLNQVVPTGEVLGTAIHLAARLASRPATAVQIMKRGLREFETMSRDEAVAASFA